ncbi:6-phosphogluconolactonase [Gemelliphila palaticanis]|uniref:Glucosamine-6-phosphate isomerase n=1 Tax=Gemelliphila palaticanis TaxID=81950 RepID=A0ABX2T056_9BACL|nr:glucosamine-6-phosphate isomerase [Gemella palaticanis]MBF0715078.1 glucosamine-6-phosphate isomerase [Gemella palaticanis]NYS47008.1 glucosamine-6-phosphate isomerase [Gemella palaticanis]
MKYIVCNSENAVFNKMYDELERFIEDGAVLSFPEKIMDTQFTKRMIDEKNNGKYRYNHIIFVGQREFANIDNEEELGIKRIMRKNIYKPLGVDYENIFYPQVLQEEDLENYREVLKENTIDVIILTLNSDGTIINYKDSSELNENINISDLLEKDLTYLKAKEPNLISNKKIINIGINDILESRNIFLVALGRDKKQYIETIFEDNEDNNNILSVLKKHKNITIFVDKELGYKSEEEVNKLIREKQRREELEKLRKIERESNKENE